MDWKEKIKNIPYGVYDGLSIISSLITIVTVIIAGFRAVVSIKQLDGHYEININPILFWVVLLAIGFASVSFVKLLKYAKLVRKLKKSFSYNYYNAAHDLRNTYFNILKKHKTEKVGEVHTRIENLTNETKSFLENSLDYLCQILEELTGKEIHGCIKLIENNNNKAHRINLNNATVRTFCRSKNSQPERNSNDQINKKSVRILENTDFYDILDTGNSTSNSYFYQSNLIEYSKRLYESGKRYKNSTLNWEKYYRSTIVAPIRVANEHLFFNRWKSGYNVVGFLCVDSMSLEAFRNTEFDKKTCSYVVKSFAAEMYIVLNMYGYYLGLMEGEIKNA